MKQIFEDIEDEVNTSYQRYRPFASHHEAYAVLLEEVEELWQEIKKKPEDYDKELMRLEAVQISAMAVKFINDFCL